MTLLTLVIAAYVLGSMATAIIASRAFGLPDPRTQGSGNPGATNVMRSGNKFAAATTLVGDLLKGTIPMWVASALNLPLVEQVVVGLAAFAGHLYPVFYRFKGGKGVATYFGVLLGLSPMLAIGCALAWLGTYKLSRISSVGAITLFIAAPALTYWTTASLAAAALIALMSVVSAWRHRENFKRLARGEELRVDSK